MVKNAELLGTFAYSSTNAGLAEEWPHDQPNFGAGIVPGLELGAIHDHTAAAGFAPANEFAFFLHDFGAADRTNDRLISVAFSNSWLRFRRRIDIRAPFFHSNRKLLKTNGLASVEV
jgi:hypothetical protein